MTAQKMLASVLGPVDLEDDIILMYVRKYGPIRNLFYTISNNKIFWIMLKTQMIRTYLLLNTFFRDSEINNLTNCSQDHRNLM